MFTSRTEVGDDDDNDDSKIPKAKHKPSISCLVFNRKGSTHYKMGKTVAHDLTNSWHQGMFK